MGTQQAIVECAKLRVCDGDTYTMQNTWIGIHVYSNVYNRLYRWCSREIYFSLSILHQDTQIPALFPLKYVFPQVRLSFLVSRQSQLSIFSHYSTYRGAILYCALTPDSTRRHVRHIFFSFIHNNAHEHTLFILSKWFLTALLTSTLNRWRSTLLGPENSVIK